MRQASCWQGRLKMLLSVLLLLVAVGLTSSNAAAQLHREDFVIRGDPGINLFVREVKFAGGVDNRPPVLLLHGARVPSIPSFDLPVPNGSLAADLAREGHAVYLMDARGYGNSTRPRAMSEPAAVNAPVVRSSEVVRDVSAVVDWVLRRRDVERLALLGWATGGHWLGYYVSLNPEKVSHLIFYNTLYAGSADHARIGHGSPLEDPLQPGNFNFADFGAYRLSTRASLLTSWDESVPVEDKGSWRDPELAEAYVELAMESDPTSFSRTPATLRAPNGALEDSYYLATGRQLWDASLIRSPTLIIASERDFWSRPEDSAMLEQQLVHAPTVALVTIPDATHYVHLDRPKRGRTVFLERVLAFLAVDHALPVVGN